MNKFKSRKFLMSLVAAGLIVANEGLGLNLPTEAVMTIAAVVVGYVASEAYVDGKRVE